MQEQNATPRDELVTELSLLMRAVARAGVAPPVLKALEELANVYGHEQAFRVWQTLDAVAAAMAPATDWTPVFDAIERRRDSTT